MKQVQSKTVALLSIVVLLAAIGYYLNLTSNQNNEPASTSQPSPTRPISEEVPQPEEPIVSPKETQEALIESFYKAFSKRDKSAIFGLFIPDTSKLEMDTRSRLLKGEDTSGNIGGPTLFESNSAGGHVTSYKIVTVDSREGDVYTIEEKATYPEGSTITRQRFLKLIQQPGDQFLIEKYFSETETGKYDGFLN